jgi:LAGLIDADG endonuclease
MKILIKVIKASIFKDMVQLDIKFLCIKHPEVKYIGFLTLLFAGTTSIFSLKYSIFNDTVKKFKQGSKSAGNLFLKKGTSETLRNGTVVSIQNVKLISVHVPRHLKPVSEDQFGHYLAGLIDGDGHFSSQQQLVIVFHSLDASLAYYIKERLGFGSIKKVKDKNAFILVLAARKGLEKVINLINGKIRTESKFNQINNNILNHDKYAEFRKTIDLKLNSNEDLKNHWLAGFSDADASFQIKVLNRGNKIEVRLNFQIEQKKDSILLLIKTFLGGNIGYRKSQDTYYYGSTSFGSAKNVVNYFDYFHLLSSKHINYLKWRKAYLIIQNRDHLNKDGLNKIIKLKSTMNRLSDTTV